MLLKPRGPLPVLALALVVVGVPAGVASAAQSPREVALRYAADNPGELGVTRADVVDLAVTSEYRSADNGVTHVNVNQRHDGLEVFGAHATINVAGDGRVIFAAGSLVRGLEGTASGTRLDALDAVEAAADELGLAEPAGLRVLRANAAPARRSVVSDGGISAEPIPARLGYQPTKDGLRLAWQVTIDDADDGHLWEATVDAASGDLLRKNDWSADAKTPNPVNDGSRYRVFEFPKGDPNDGDRTLVTNPADAFASPFGWHDTNGAPGPEFTRTQGNNVHAYSDRDANNLPDPNSDPDGGPTLNFDFIADYFNEQPQSYVDAAVTNLFYWCNMVHDLTYQYGFDEASGNFQVNNYGRGGVGGDDVRCEGQDGSGTNNANFSTPANDGGRPRMQMFLWPGLQLGLPNALTVNAPSPAAGTYGANYARFSPAPTNAGLNGTIVLVDDGTAPVNDGCEPFTVPAGAIALVDNSTTCNAYTRTVNAQNGGAAALVIAHNTAADPPILNGSMEPPVGIPAIAISQAAGTAIKAALPAAGSVHRNRDRPAMRDADFRSETIFHEYGHGVSLRLTGGPNVNCLTGNEQAGEGWSDFLAITILMNPAIDNPEGPRGYGQWALYADSRVGPGFRPRPYSRNMALQPFTYDSIKTGAWLDGTSLALPHGLGHGWAAVLWDMAWDLVEKHGFNPNVYGDWNTGGNNRALQYVIDGLKMQGCGPGLVVARAAIIAAADRLSGGEDTCTVWASFARRGLGFSAVQGTTDRDDNEEAYDTHPSCRRGFESPVRRPYGELNPVDAGEAVPLRFTAGGMTGEDILASNSPFSRRVDCQTLKVPSQGQAVTPREFPIATQSNRGLRLMSNGLYAYNWRTLPAWEGTCREVVVTRKDGRQHRAFFRFV
jgi:extracellular elastinolytic metalloproteinase